MAELTIGAHNYRTRPMDVMVQLFVAKRVAPVISQLSGIVQAADGKPDAVVTQMVLRMAELPDDDIGFILDKCMSLVLREQVGQWVPAWNGNAKRPQFDDLSLADLLQLTGAVFMENLQSFLPDRPPASA